jgi:16S rRNA (guanine527-N7)-methyltransferase
VFADLLRARFPALTVEQVSQLAAHYNLMVRWNRTLNLTTVTDPAGSVERHYAESLFLAEHIDGPTVVDIGSGPGFPGIPVAILHPEWIITLIESHQRKAVFLKEATRGLPNVKVLAQRAEKVNATYDWAISRAVSYADLAKSLPALAPRVALLTGAEPWPSARPFTWDPPIPLPTARGFLRIGRAIPPDRAGF